MASTLDDLMVDKTLYLRPLEETGFDVANDLQGTERGKCCGLCGKPFHATREWESVARAIVANELGETYSWSWLLCGRCTRDSKRNGNAMPERLKREAVQEALLLMATPNGTA